METQLIILGGDSFCTVFSVAQDAITIHGIETADHQPHIRAWLEQEGYPKAGILLREHVAGTLPQGFYIKPHMGNLYFRVDQITHQLTPVNAADFDEPIATEQI